MIIVCRSYELIKVFIKALSMSKWSRRERHYQSLIKINLSCFFVDTSSSVCLTTDCIETGKC